MQETPCTNHHQGTPVHPRQNRWVSVRRGAVRSVGPSVRGPSARQRIRTRLKRPGTAAVLACIAKYFGHYTIPKPQERFHYSPGLPEQTFAPVFTIPNICSWSRNTAIICPLKLLTHTHTHDKDKYTHSHTLNMSSLQPRAHVHAGQKYAGVKRYKRHISGIL